MIWGHTDSWDDFNAESYLASWCLKPFLLRSSHWHRNCLHVCLPDGLHCSWLQFYIYIDILKCTTLVFALGGSMLQAAGFRIKQEDGHRPSTATTRPKPVACSIPGANGSFIYPSQMTCTQDGSGCGLHGLYCLTCYSAVWKTLWCAAVPGSVAESSIHDRLLPLPALYNELYLPT